MRVFEIRTYGDRYQSLELADAPPPGISLDEWVASLPFFINRKRGRRGAFYASAYGYLVTSPHACDILQEYLEGAGDVRPFTLYDQRFTFVGAIPYLDVLDHHRSIFRHYSNGAIAEVKQFAFHADRFPTRTCLFRLHEGLPNVYVLEGVGGFTREFREIVKAEGLKPIYFRELWNNEQEPEFCGTPWGVADFFYDRWREMATDASV